MIAGSLSLEERREHVLETLRPDDIRNHRVAEGLPLDSGQLGDLDRCATQAAALAIGMSTLSQRALEAEPSDRQMRVIRELLGTEGVFQAVLRGEATLILSPLAEITKVDLISTSDGLRMVEVEPGKIRGLGYGMMVRSQSSNSPGSGIENILKVLSEGDPTGIIMSRSDRFHEPEMRLVASSIGSVSVVTQALGVSSNGHILPEANSRPVKNAIMMSRLERTHGLQEQDVRQSARVVSDRRSDLESKGALAIVHNIGRDELLEDVLVDIFGKETLGALRQLIPKTAHISLLNSDQLAALRTSIQDGMIEVFLKPLADSGTRGIVVPGDKEQQLEILNKPKKLRRFVIQEARSTLPEKMESLDVLTGDRRIDVMNIRLTVHIDRLGNIIEVSVVGSPHEYLAHGGRTSVITNAEKVF